MKITLALSLVIILVPGIALATYQIGDAVDDFTLPDPQGQPVSLSDFAGQVVLINFFATWCPPCNEEAPQLQDMYESLGTRGFSVLAVDLLEDPDQVAGWTQSLGLTYPVVISPDWSLFQLFPQAGGIPYNAVVDQDGFLRYSQYGSNLEELDDLVRELLGEDPVASFPRALAGIKALYR